MYHARYCVPVRFYIFHSVVINVVVEINVCTHKNVSDLTYLALKFANIPLVFSPILTILVPFWCFSTLVKYYFEFSFDLKGNILQ